MKEYITQKTRSIDATEAGGGIFSAAPNPEARIILNQDQLIKYVEACRTLNLSIVMTSGSFDLIHVGHAKYLEQAKSHGDVLLVAVDNDEKVRHRKGELRPVVPEDERARMLAHLRSVDIVTLKPLKSPKWELIKKIKPDTLVVTDETYDEAALLELTKLCGRIVSLEPQATTSTSAQIRRLQVGWTTTILKPVQEILEKYHANDTLRDEINEILKKWRQ